MRRFVFLLSVAIVACFTMTMEGQRAVFRFRQRAPVAAAASGTLCGDATTKLYVRDGATGAANGANWTDAYDDLPAALTRGTTYCVADGAYISYALNDAVSGTTVIQIVKATTTDHGTETGWVSTYGDGQASFGTLTCATQYWRIDGQTRTDGAGWTAPTGYGFRADGIAADSLDGDNCSNSSFRYIDIGPAYTETYVSGWGVPVRLVYTQTDITFAYCALHNGVATLFQGAGADNITWEYCDIGPGWGKEALRGGNGSISSGWITRYNRFWNASQTDPDDPTSGITAEIGIWDFTGTCNGHEIYGNWFFSDKTGARNAVVLVGGDGAGWVGDGCDGTVFYNNTIASVPEASVFPMVDLNGSSTIARNTLFYDVVDADVSATTTSDNTEVMSDPFVTYASVNLHLSAQTVAGFTLGSPYNTDRDGVTRGQGVWDLGAYEKVP